MKRHKNELSVEPKLVSVNRIIRRENVKKHVAERPWWQVGMLISDKVWDSVWQPVRLQVRVNLLEAAEKEIWYGKPMEDFREAAER